VIELIEAKKAEVAMLCRKYGVRRLDAFGSVTTDAFDPATSDLDFIADFADRSPGYADRYLDFAESLEALFGRPVDLMTEDMIKSPIFREEVESHRTPVYEANNREAAA
jgi:hypothetical protein